AGTISLIAALFASLFQEWLRAQPPWIILLCHLQPWEPLRQATAWVLTRFWPRFLTNIIFWLLLGVSIATGVSLFSRLVRRRISWMSGFSVFTWASLPLAFPSPLLLFGERLVAVDALRVFTCSVYALVLCWCLWRGLRGLQILLRTRLWNTLFGTFWVTAVAGAIGFGIYEVAYSLSTYVGYILSLWDIP
ncbi:MAG: hypothetical protein NZ949_05565, partial [Candidatus Kapabacteria bacterium]|nr:hypothetical protein [Candidatus Kapabacteria bacterium]